jgi:SAM-dependent methyltransferase
LRRQQFQPGLVGVFVNPFFLARRQLWNEIAAVSDCMSGPLLDVGCGTKPYRSLFATNQYIGLDIDNEIARVRGIADVLYDGSHFPFEDGQFGALLCNQVLEHVFNPDEFLREMHRVLLPGGQLLLTVPFVWDEHEQPYDYARYSSFGLKALLERNGFVVIEHKKLLDNFSLIFQLINAYLYKITRTRFALLNLAATVTLMAPFTVAGLVLGALLPRNTDLFLDQLVLARRT